MIVHDVERRLWILSGHSSCHVLHLDGADRLHARCPWNRPPFCWIAPPPPTGVSRTPPTKYWT
ncbi:hypothetical protein [Streptosporangium sp. NPDC002721]|uniref:hypothetical protein n=1 Tax=Streptosporangium sp. NPDC002721 TaxID=3366188 RepID=UPI0036B4B8A9